MEGGNVVSFKSAYIAKIIDYGRCYFDDAENTDVTGNSKRIYNAICAQNECDPKCGSLVGFSWLEPLSPTDKYYVSSQIPNVSFDLRILIDIKWKIYSKYKPLFDVAHKVVYNSEDYGTPSINKSGLFENKINNVKDACLALQGLIATEIATNEDFYKNHTKLGDMHIYADGSPLQYT
jgi:hypothetical protein